MSKLRVMLIFGTRPEAIKMAPVVRQCLSRPDELETVVCLTGQHREMLQQVTDYFEIEADIDLQLMQPNQTLSEFDVTIEPSDVVKEVGVFAERADISEEIVRLRSHLEQFISIMQAEESAGRKLEFLAQEMFREINTIGSKANDAEIARYVIDIKAAIERIREMIQNVE